MILALLACTGPPAGDSGVVTGPIVLTDANNYSYTMDLAIGVLPISPTAEAAVDWSGLGTDLQGFAVDPAEDVVALSLVWLRDLDAGAVEDAIVTGSLVQSSIGLYARVTPAAGATRAALTEFEIYGAAFDPEAYLPADTGTWLLRVSTATNDNAMLAILAPGDGPATAWLDDTTTTLTFDPDLLGLTPVRVGADLGVEWGGLTRDARGGELDPWTLQELVLAWYEGLTPADLEARFFELETLASREWTATVHGEESFDLHDAIDEAEVPFSGFDETGDGTWMLGLRCTVCASPAPAFLTVLEPG